MDPVPAMAAGPVLLLGVYFPHRTWFRFEFSPLCVLGGISDRNERLRRSNNGKQEEYQLP